jgi:hypothetical protein
MSTLSPRSTMDFAKDEAASPPPTVTMSNEEVFIGRCSFSMVQ